MPGRTRISGGSCHVNITQEHGCNCVVTDHEDPAHWLLVEYTDEDGKKHRRVLHIHGHDDVVAELTWSTENPDT